MATRIGIELSPAACRIVEIAAPARRRGGVIRVRSFSAGPRLGVDTTRRLAALRGRQAAVVAWGVRGEYRRTMVTAGRYDAMRKEAAASLEHGGLDMRGALTDIAPLGPADPRAPDRRPVLMALASRDQMADALRPLSAAGIRIRSVVTPGAALASLARLRRTTATAGRVDVYVALEEAATCIALMRDHVLIAAADLPWGYVEEHEPFGECAPRSAIAARLADELADFFAAMRIDPSAVRQICMCGGVPELRSMTAPMMEKLDVEIEPLDSLSGIDADRLPEPAAEFRECSVALRLAWAIAADWRAPLNLLRDRRRRAVAVSFARAAVVAGVGAGVGVGWGIQRAELPQPAAAVPIAQLAAIVPVSARRGTTTVRPVGRHDALEPHGTVSDAVAVAPPHAANAPIAASPFPPSPQRSVSVPSRQTPVVAVVAAAVRSTAPERALPSDDVLGTILFGPDRQLAIVDGRIVEAGDAVHGGRIVEITSSAVLLRDGAGRLRRLSLSGEGR